MIPIINDDTTTRILLIKYLVLKESYVPVWVSCMAFSPNQEIHKGQNGALINASDGISALESQHCMVEALPRAIPQIIFNKHDKSHNAPNLYPSMHHFL